MGSYFCQKKIWVVFVSIYFLVIYTYFCKFHLNTCVNRAKHWYIEHMLKYWHIEYVSKVNEQSDTI